MIRTTRVLILLTAILISSFLLAQQTASLPAEPQMTPEDEARKNSVKPTKESIETGKKLFDSQCTMCHGERGDGKGDLAVDKGWSIVDFIDAKAMKERTDGALFFVLTKGRSHMPGQESRMKDEQKWHLVNFIRSLSAPAENKPSEKAEKRSTESRD